MANETEPKKKRQRKPKQPAEPKPLYDLVLLAPGRRPEVILRAAELGDVLWEEHQHNVIRGRTDALAVVASTGVIQRFF